MILAFNVQRIAKMMLIRNGSKDREFTGTEMKKGSKSMCIQDHMMKAQRCDKAKIIFSLNSIGSTV